MDCSRIDDLLVDYIYQELNPSQVELFEAHLQGCDRCTQEVSALEGTRSMFASLPEEDPPAQISALLLQEASRAVQPPEPGFWERLRVGLRSLAMHPATTAAVTLTLVLGISFYVYKNNPAPGDSAKVDLPTPLMGEDSPTATISSMSEGKGAAAVSEKRIADKRPAQPTEGMVAANEDEAARNELDSVTVGKSGLARKADQQRAPEVATRGPRANAVGSTRGRLQASQVMYKDGLDKNRFRGVGSGTGPTDSVAQKPVVMPPPPAATPAPAAVAAAPDNAPVKPTVKLRKRARRMTRKGPGVWDDDEVKGETQARVPKTPPAPRADLSRSLANKKESERDDRAQGESAKRKGRTARYAHAKSKPRARPTRVARRPAAPMKSPPPVKKPAPQQASAGKKQAAKAKDGKSNALSFLFLGNKAAQNGRCSAALDHFHRALLQDRSLRTRVSSAMRSCTSKMNLNQLLAAQRRHQMLAGLLESDIKRARQVQQYAARKRAAKKKTKAKKTTQKKARSKGSVKSIEAAPSAK